MLTAHRLKQQMSTGEKTAQAGLPLHQRPRSLFNKMVFNRFKDFLTRSPWAHSRRCFLATIYLSVMPTSSRASAWGHSLASICLPQSLPGCGVRPCVPSVCPPAARSLASVSESASRLWAGVSPHWCSLLLPASIWLCLSPSGCRSPPPLLPLSLSPSLRQRESLDYLCSPFNLQGCSSGSECLGS